MGVEVPEMKILTKSIYRYSKLLLIVSGTPKKDKIGNSVYI